MHWLFRDLPEPRIQPARLEKEVPFPKAEAKTVLLSVVSSIISTYVVIKLLKLT